MPDQPIIGVVCLETTFDKIRGHIRHVGTFDFPLRFKVISGATPARLISDRDSALLDPFIAGARELEAGGVDAITGSCGFLVLFQKEIANALTVPFFSSSLLQVPMLQSMGRDSQRIGILVANRRAFTRSHLEAIGAADAPVAVEGMEDQPEFREVILEGRRDTLDVNRLRNEVLSQARKLVGENPDIGPLVLECTDLPPFSSDIQKAVGRPVYDIVTLTRTVHEALRRPDYLAASPAV